jgi:hypothetical protein
LTSCARPIHFAAALRPLARASGVRARSAPSAPRSTRPALEQRRDRLVETRVEARGRTA